MKEAQTYLTQKQVEEIGAYHASTAGVLRSLANGANGMPDDSLPYLRQTGEWNSKTTEDYVAMCRERIAATPETVEDLGLLAGEWRNAVVAESVGNSTRNSPRNWVETSPLPTWTTGWNK